MASLMSKNQHYRIVFRWSDRKRYTLRLGRVSRRDAVLVHYHVESIISARVSGLPLRDEQLAWLRDCPDLLRDCLHRVKLAEPGKSALLGEVCARAFASRQIKPATKTAYGHAIRCLTDFFTAQKDIRQITAADAEAFRDAMRASDLAEATLRRRCGVARDIFRTAIKAKLLDENPFADLPTACRGSTDRAALISISDTQKLLDACPDAQWRLLISLARFGGLRIPSEPLGLTWADIDFPGGKITVKSPKTEHHAGHSKRTIPMFPELRRPLEELFLQESPAATDHVITRYRSSAINLRTQLGRICRRAGVGPFPKPWTNMRATRDAELRRDYPAHVVRQWIGHSERVAQDHYLLATDDSYIARAASAAPSGSDAGSRHVGVGADAESQSGAQSGARRNNQEPSAVVRSHQPKTHHTHEITADTVKTEVPDEF